MRVGRNPFDRFRYEPIELPMRYVLLILAASLFTLCGLSELAVADVVPVPQHVQPQRIEHAKPRNVVFILSDDHRYDAMSFLGHQLAQTPHMDAMAAGGVWLV